MVALDEKDDAPNHVGYFDPSLAKTRNSVLLQWARTGKFPASINSLNNHGLTCCLV
jgi:hypothetical protein